VKSFLAAFVGTLAAVLIIVLITGGYAACVSGKKAKIEDNSYLIVEMFEPILEYDPPGGIMSQIGGGEVETLQRILDNLKKAAADDRIEGVILKVGMGSSVGFGAAEEIRGAIKRLRETGKPVYGYAESFERNEYLLLAACDEILAPPTAYINFMGIGGASMHVKKALDKLGIRPNVHKIKDYKSAAELVTREHMSAPARENTEWLLDEVWAAFMQAMREDRDMGEDKIVELMEHALFTTQEALDGGLVDRIAYWDELETELKGEDEEELPTVSQSRYAQVEPSKLGFEGDKTIAVIHAQGSIFGRESGVNPLLGLTMGHETIVEEFRRAREDEDVAAIVFRIDSGGGDALGSDLMGHEVELTNSVKPVVASMVNVAASGGYHIAYRASKIVADPMTITGSIGSISGKFNVAGLYDKLGITYDHIARGPNALMNSDLRDFTPEERARFEQNHWDGFNDWLRDVAEHRGMTFEEAEKLAHGRVWSGKQAVENGLIDETGDLEHAILVAKRLAEIPDDEEVTVAHFPKKKGLLESILGGDRQATTAARWVVYRFIQEDVAETWSLLRRNPELAAELLGP
jgi:protease-4